MARIVVVDDERDIREMLAEFLRAEGHEVLAAADGAALDRLLAEGAAPDAFLLDVGLPGRDGFTLARELRAGQARAAILMLTGLGDPVDRVVGLEVGADDYIEKPVALPELSARIAAVLRRRRPASEIEAGVRFGLYRLDSAPSACATRPGGRSSSARWRSIWSRRSRPIRADADPRRPAAARAAARQREQRPQHRPPRQPTAEEARGGDRPQPDPHRPQSWLRAPAGVGRGRSAEPRVAARAPRRVRARVQSRPASVRGRAVGDRRFV